MKRSFKNLSVIILFLISLIASGLDVRPAYAAASMEVVPLPLPSEWISGHLYNVWGSGASDIYVVGYGNKAGTTSPLLFHYNGSVWGEASPALPGGWSSGYLYGVWGSSASDVYVVGSGYSGNTFRPLLYHNNGSGWTGSSLPLPAGVTSGSLYGIWGSSASDIYAVGYGNSGGTTVPLLYRNNGSGWSEASPSVPVGWNSGYFESAWSSSASNVYVVGYGNNGSTLLPLLYHTDGGGSSASTFDLPGGWPSGYLYGIWGSRTGTVFTVGYGNNGSTTAPLLYQNNGSGWIEAGLTVPGGWTAGYLYGVWGSRATNVYAVGSGNTHGALAPLLYHNNGSGWSEASPALPSGWSFGYLQSVWGSGTGDVYAVGTGNDGSKYQPLLYHSVPEPDFVAPGDITGLSASTGTADGSVNLSWTAPLDDAGIPASGSVDRYLVKYSSSPFTSWTDGTLVTTDLPEPAAPGATQTMTVSGLSPGTLYYFAVRAEDEASNQSNYVTISATTRAPTQINFSIGGSDKGSYYTQNSSLQQSYAATLGGPVNVLSMTGQPVVTSQRVVYGNSFNELMGYPANRFTTEYWFPWYDMVYMNTWVLVGNPSATQTAYVDIYIGGMKKNNTPGGIPYAIPPGDRVLPQFPGVLDGPVRVVSVTGAGTPTALPIFASERSTYLSSFNEVMGYPADQFTTEYWFPWYDQVYMNTWILVGNPSSTQTAYVDIYIGGVKRGSDSIPPNGRILPQFSGVVAGPVRVVSVTGTGTPTPLPVFASERSTYQGSFNEVMGYPANQFTTEYWYTWYDNLGMASWLLVGNPSTTQTAYVDIYIGGVKQNSTYVIPASGSVIPRFNLSSGPVRVVSVTGAGTPTAIPVFTSERSLYGPSFNEMMGYPADQLSSEYWFTWYDSLYMATDLVVGVP